VFPVLGFALLLLLTLVFLASRYKRCPSDKILVVFGKVGAGQSARCIHGGGVLVLPLIQGSAYLSLTPITISIPLQKASSMQNIRINVPSTFTVGVSTEKEIVTAAAERLLNLSPSHIEEMAKEIIFGQLRLTVASLTIEQINQDRESFLEAIRKNVSPELDKIGLFLINVNITDITDESGYIDSIGKKAAAEAINQAKVDVAVQEKSGGIGESEALREREIRVAENVAEALKGKKRAEAGQRVFIKHQEAAAVGGENEALADIARTNAELAVRQAEAARLGEVARREAEVEIQKAQKIEQIVQLQVEAIRNIKIDKVTVWDSAGKDGTSTSAFLAGLIKSLPPLHDVAGLAGVQLPEYLGSLARADGESKVD